MTGANSLTPLTDTAGHAGAGSTAVREHFGLPCEPAARKLILLVFIQVLL